MLRIDSDQHRIGRKIVWLAVMVLAMLGVLSPWPSIHAQQTPILEVTPSRLTFQAQRGGPPPDSQALTVQNTGEGRLEWEITDNADWLISESRGALGGGHSYELDLAVAIQGLRKGTHDAEISVTAGGAENSPVVIPVSLTLADAESAPTTHIVQPSDLAAATLGQDLRIEWIAEDLNPDGTFEIWFRTPDGQWQIIEEREAGPGSLAWTVPEVEATGVGRLWVGNLTDPDGANTSEKYEAFHETKLRFHEDRPAPSTLIIQPTHGDRINAGERVRIEWTAADLDTAGTLEIWVQLEGQDWKKLADRNPGPGSFVWTAPPLDQATSAKIWVGNLTNPKGEGNVERYEVFDQITVQVEPEPDQASGLAACDEGEAVFSDDFTDPASGWLQDSGDGFDWSYDEGEYRVFITDPGFTAWSWAPLNGSLPEAFCLQADVKLLSQGSLSEVGLLGLVFAGDRDADSFHFLGIAPTFGTFGIGNCFPCEETITEPTSSEAVNPVNEFTTLTVLKREDGVAFYIGETLVTEAEVPTSGSVGVFTRTFEEPNVNGRFDNFVVRSLP